MVSFDPWDEGENAEIGLEDSPSVAPNGLQPASRELEELDSDDFLIDDSLVPYQRPPWLYELYQSPPLRAVTEGRRRTSRSERRYMAYRFAEGETCAVIAQATGIPEATVRSFRRRVLEDAGQLLDCDFVMLIELAEEQWSWRYLCRYCGCVREKSWQATRHAIGHLR